MSVMRTSVRCDMKTAPPRHLNDLDGGAMLTVSTTLDPLPVTDAVSLTNFASDLSATDVR